MAKLTWYAQDSFGATTPIPESGTEPNSYPGNLRIGRVVDPGAGAIVWSSDWDQASGPPGTPSITYPDGPNPDDVFAGDVNWPQGVSVDPFSLGGEGVGELRLFCEVDGVPVPGYLWMAFTMNGGPYTDVSWGVAGPAPATEFWTDFRGTFEVVN